MTVKNYFVHESSYVDDHVQIGEGTKIWYFSHVMGEAKIGRNCIIGQNVSIESQAVIGDGCKIQNNVSVYKGVILEDEVFCGPSCVFTNVYNPRSFIERKHEFRQTIVKKGATIGANATIICGATIGRYALIGAGAVVRQDVPDYAVMAGVPARQVGWACKCGTSLGLPGKKGICRGSGAKDQPLIAKCGYCGNEYRLQGRNLAPLVEDKALPTQHIA